VLARAQKKAEETLKQAQQTKSAEQFGLLAEQVSDDDWHTQMGARKTMEMKDLPPMVATAAKGMKVGDVSSLIQVGNAWVIIRLNARAMPGKTPFDTVQKKLSTDLQKQKTVEVRTALNQKLHHGAKIEVL
jgi:parvulin-like peptidyl-prolyl isomerase